MADDPLLYSTLVIPNAHASAITALQYLGSLATAGDLSNKNIQRLRFATASNDQRLKTWVVSVDLEKENVDGVEVVREGSERSCVADVAALGVWRGEGEEGNGVVLAGIGMEVWEFGGGKGEGEG